MKQNTGSPYIRFNTVSGQKCWESIYSTQKTIMRALMDIDSEADRKKAAIVALAGMAIIAGTITDGPSQDCKGRIEKIRSVMSKLEAVMDLAESLDLDLMGDPLQ